MEPGKFLQASKQPHSFLRPIPRSLHHFTACFTASPSMAATAGFIYWWSCQYQTHTNPSCSCSEKHHSQAKHIQGNAVFLEPKRLLYGKNLSFTKALFYIQHKMLLTKKITKILLSLFWWLLYPVVDNLASIQHFYSFIFLLSFAHVIN